MRRRNDLLSIQNPARPTRLLLLLPLVAALIYPLATAGRVSAQNTREERCRNNRTRLGELEKQARELERDLSWTDKKIADARTAMVIARKTIRNELAGVEDENEAWQNGSLSGIYARLSRMAKEYNYDVDMCIGSRVDCLRKIPAEIGKHIDRANTLRPHRAEMQQKKVDVDNQIAYHRGRMAELGCEESSKKEKSDSLVGTWNWECCEKKYSGTFTLGQNGNKLNGSFSDGSKIEGDINGSTVTFKRTGSFGRQDFTLTLSADGKTLTGSFSGDRNKSVGVQFTATRP